MTILVPGWIVTLAHGESPETDPGVTVVPSGGGMIAGFRKSDAIVSWEYAEE